ncbi:MAG: hypothetical protein HKN68_16400 [Saprospiraceae bacterium]|nr:hypothetical protein [Saprospiraceae bacterium]
MKFIKWVAGIILVVIIALFILIKVASEDRPESNPSSEADEMATQMLNTLGKPAWDSLKLMSWSFIGQHHYVWNKPDNIAEIRWDDIKVILNLNTLEARAWKNDEEVPQKEITKYRDAAWEYWCNDSFWLFAPFKVFDPGTTRSIVTEVEHGKYGLLVSYESGGVTPGDAYLWHLDENYRPVGYKMWVKIIPVGGIYVGWEDWVILGGGIQIAQQRKGSVLSLSMDNIRIGNSYEDLGLSGDPFLQ